MWAGKSGGGFQHIGRGDTHAHISNIHNRVPVAAELSDLLRVDLQQQVSAMAVAGGVGEHVMDFQAASGNSGENPHQRALCVAIVDVKCVHFLLLPKLLM